VQTVREVTGRFVAQKFKVRLIRQERRRECIGSSTARYRLNSFLLALALGWQTSLRHAATPQFNVNEVTALEAKALIDAGAMVIDVRERAASERNHLPGARLIPLEVLPDRLAQLESAKANKIVVYCGNGSTRGPAATSKLNSAGFAQAVNMKSGFEGWREAGLPTASFSDTPSPGVRG
jgi:rhodanese-related sulfurtransferase